MVSLFLFALSSIAAATMLASSASAGLSGCPKSLALQLTNVFQYGQIQFNYSNCGKDDSGNGYAAGIVNFCTGTSDAWEVIKAYHSLTGGNDEFTQYDSMLKKYASTNDGSTKGLDGFCNAWKKAATNQKFWSAQGTVFDKLYFAPSQAFANKLGLQLSVSQGQMYDAAISHGVSNSSKSLGGLIKATNKKFTNNTLGNSGNNLNINGHQVDEIVWLEKFIDIRKASFNNTGDLVNINSYSYIISQGEYKWTHNIQVLNNKGSVGNVTCDNSYQPSNINPNGDNDGEESASLPTLETNRILLAIGVAIFSSVLVGL